MASVASIEWLKTLYGYQKKPEGNQSFQLQKKIRSSNSYRLKSFKCCSNVVEPLGPKEDLSQLGKIQFLKDEIVASLNGINRGIFGVDSKKRQHIEDKIMDLESINPTPEPLCDIQKVSGVWRLLYSTIKITGSKRTKLGLREFVKLGEFRQIIRPEDEKAVNVVEFNVAGFGLLSGSLTIEASYSVESPQRVSIVFEKSSIVPQQLLGLFEKNYDLLLSLFNPEGWLDVTYVDNNWRIGRDDKGNIFLVEKVE